MDNYKKMDVVVNIEDNFVVSLDPLRDNDILAKKVDRSYMEKQVKELLAYMLNPQEDNLNPEYNATEQETVKCIRNLMNEANANPVGTRLELAAMSVKGNDTISLSLEEKLASYASEIVKIRSIPGTDEQMPYLGLLCALMIID